mmetsp:Transcript_9617/g.22300  ORF Transcript_9617/g.22300 Transcript_9617/m.22300 type:complete len:338 (+) Transcript_9617:4102-5115(+)
MPRSMPSPRPSPGPWVRVRCRRPSPIPRRTTRLAWLRSRWMTPSCSLLATSTACPSALRSTPRTRKSTTTARPPTPWAAPRQRPLAAKTPAASTSVSVTASDRLRPCGRCLSAKPPSGGFFFGCRIPMSLARQGNCCVNSTTTPGRPQSHWLRMSLFTFDNRRQDDEKSSTGHRRIGRMHLVGLGPVQRQPVWYCRLGGALHHQRQPGPVPETTGAGWHVPESLGRERHRGHGRRFEGHREHGASAELRHRRHRGGRFLAPGLGRSPVFGLRPDPARPPVQHPVRRLHQHVCVLPLLALHRGVQAGAGYGAGGTSEQYGQVPCRVRQPARRTASQCR